MGLFSSKKTIKVASTVYNMAGLEADRPNFLKNTIFSAIMNPNNVWLGETLVGNYLSGPGIRQRNFFNWAVDNDYPGLPTYSISQVEEVDPDVVKPFITVPGSPAGLVTEIQNATINDGDFSYFAEQYILANSPELADSAYVAEYLPATHEIIIEYELGGNDTFAAGIYDSAKSFLVANHYFQVPASLESLITGSTTTGVTDPGLLPDLTGYVLDNTLQLGNIEYHLEYVKTVLVEYSDNRPDEGPDDTNEHDHINFDGTHEEWRITLLEGGDGQSQEVVHKEYFHHLYETRDVFTDTQIVIVVNEDTPDPGVTQTITTTTVGDHIRPIWDWRTDTQDTINNKSVGGPQIFIYEMGSGEAVLDDLQSDVATSDTEFYPFLPIRLDNQSILHADFDDQTGNGLFAITNTAWRKVSGGIQKFTALVEEVEANADIGDIDYAYIQFGVSLNVIEPSCRKYMYEFLENLITHQNTNQAYMGGFETAVTAYVDAISDLDDWIVAQNDVNDPLYDTARPSIPNMSQPESTTIKLVSDHASLSDFDVRLSWINIDETTHSGVGIPGAVGGDIEFVKDGTFDWTEFSGLGAVTDSSYTGVANSVEKIKLYWQIDTTNYKILTIFGLVYQNYVYGGKSVNTSAHEALDDANPSGFLIPIHQPSASELGLVHATQMATANTFIVFNTYQVFQQQWYQTFLGMLFIFIAIVIVSVLINPAFIGGIQGVLGTNAWVGLQLGLAGNAGIVAGAITNALAAIVIASALTEGSIAIFGEKYGALIGSIISFAVTVGLSGGFGAGNLTDLLNPQNLLQFSSALANGYQGFVQAEISTLQDQMIVNQEEYNKASQAINELINEMGFNNDLSFDPMQLTDVRAGNGQGGFLPESLDEFIHRTLMTGSDIVGVTLSLVTDYPDLSLTLPRT